MNCEIITSHDHNLRGRAMLAAMFKAAPVAGIQCVCSDKYSGKRELMMSYGLGHTGRRHWIDAQLKRGGRVIGWDLGYWDRDSKMRLTIDRDHPQHLMQDFPSVRFDRAPISLLDSFDPAGPIILAGMGRKSRKAFGIVGLQWELDMLSKIKAAYPSKKILYRPKRPETIPGIRSIAGPINEAIAGASLVVCHHSNVAVDACISGIPVVCSDGAASALYGNDLHNPVNPSASQRLQFLKNLAWWQWSPNEAIEAWRFICKICA